MVERDAAAEVSALCPKETTEGDDEALRDLG
jgi:hypothetical protein